MGKIKRTGAKPKKKKSKLSPIEKGLGEAMEAAATDIVSQPADEYTSFLRYHIYETCKEILNENRSQIIARAEERIRAVQAMQKHK